MNGRDTADSSPLCSAVGRPELYGLGIRMAFYTQWLGAVLVEYFDEDDLPDVRFLGSFLSAAATTSLIVQLAQDKLETMDIYFMLLLSMGIFFFLIPLYVWRVLTRCNPNLDPFALSKERHGLVYHCFTFFLLAANASVGTWFYTAHLPNLHRDCRQWAFVFGKANIEDKRYIAFTAMFYICILVACVAIFLFHPCCRITAEVDRRYWSRVRKTHIGLLHEARTLCGFAVFGVLVAAIELSINWNDITDISDVTTSAQLIPFFLSVGIVIRVWVQHQVLKEYNASGETTTSESEVQAAETAQGYESIPWPPQTYRRSV